jgi:hypothetical protein
MPLFGGLLTVPRRAAGATGYSGKLNHAVHLAACFNRILEIKETSFTSRVPLFVIKAILNE